MSSNAVMESLEKAKAECMDPAVMSRIQEALNAERKRVESAARKAQREKQHAKAVEEKKAKDGVKAELKQREAELKVVNEQLKKTAEQLKVTTDRADAQAKAAGKSIDDLNAKLESSAKQVVKIQSSLDVKTKEYADLEARTLKLVNVVSGIENERDKYRAAAAETDKFLQETQKKLIASQERVEELAKELEAIKAATIAQTEEE